MILLGILLFCFGIYLLIPKKKESNYYLQHPELNTTISFDSNGKQCHKWDKPFTIDAFHYHNRQVYIRMMDGEEMSGMLENLTVTFMMGQRGMFECLVDYGKQAFHIYPHQGIFTIEDYILMFDILSHSGRVGGMSDLNSYKAKRNLTNQVKGFITGNKVDSVDVFHQHQNTPQHIISAPKPYDKYARIRDLKALLDTGAISQEEFEIKKKEILGY